MKIKKNAILKYDYFLKIGEQSRSKAPLSRIDYDPNGRSGLECFHLKESKGKSYPCRDPESLYKMINGKWIHGVTVDMASSDFLENPFLLCSEEIKVNYPEWVSEEIFSQAEKKCREKHGFVLSYIKNRRDFSER